MKRFLGVFIIFAIILNFGWCFAEEKEPEAITDNLIKVENKLLLEQNDKKALVSFDVINTTDVYYPSLNYIVSLSKLEDVGGFLMSSEFCNYEPVSFEIGPNQKKTLTYSCTFPYNLPKGKYCLDIVFYEKTHQVSLVKEPIILNNMGNREEFLKDNFDSYLMVDDVYEIPLSGPNVNVNSDVKANFSVTSLFNEKHLFTPKISIYKRNQIYNSKPVLEKYGSSIEIKPNEIKIVSIDLPIISVPESYLVEICLLDENLVQASSNYSFRYVTTGVVANIKSFDAKINEKNELDVSLWAMGPADRGTIEGCTVEIEVFAENGKLVDKKVQNVNLGSNSVEISMTIENGELNNIGKVIVKGRISYGKEQLALEERTVNIEKISSEDEKMFSDIIGTKYEEAVRVLNGLGVLNGYPDGTFRPENTITRAEVTAIMTKLNKFNINANEGSKFWDVVSMHWAKPYINACSENGLVSGYTDGSFMPENNVTYAEAITILVNSLGYKNEVIRSNEGWPNNYIRKSAGIGIHNELNIVDYFLPATRGNIAILTLNAYLMK